MATATATPIIRLAATRDNIEELTGFDIHDLGRPLLLAPAAHTAPYDLINTNG
ncbi:MAG: hypothetical protein OEV40_30595 [Acidimicrobiia bacterium]|nr:hypothetical protein [Acidimicrobiia bacterium]